MTTPPPLAPNPPRHLIGVAGLAQDTAGRVLLVRSPQRGWEPPGGHVEAGEDLLTALMREVEEESGCRVQPQRLLGCYSLCDPPYLLLAAFRCTYVAGRPRPSPETTAAAWFAPEVARTLVSPPPAHFPLGDALAPAPGVIYRAYAGGREVRRHAGWESTGPGGMSAPGPAQQDDSPRHIVAAAACVRDAAGRVLLVRTAWRGWEFPGGQVELGEDLVGAVEREITEESGCRARIGPLLGVYCNTGVPPIVQFLFAGAYLAGTATPSAETPEVAWFAPAAALALPMRAPAHARLRDALTTAPGLAYRVYRTRPAYVLLHESRLPAG